MTLHQLRIFAAVAKHLNITSASRELHISQPSVSQQLKLLRTEFGLTLFKKAGRGIELTNQGRLFLSGAEPILLAFENLKKRFSGKVNQESTGYLTVGGTHGPSASLLPLVSAVFQETYPHVQLTLKTDTSREMQGLVRKGHVEVAVITNPSHYASLAYDHFRKEKLVMFASVKHSWGNREKLTVAELALAPLVIKRTKGVIYNTDEILKQLEERGVRPNIALECESPEAVKAAVKSGLGLGVLYKGLVEADVKAGYLKIIKIPELPMHVDSFVIYHKERPLSPNAQAFLTLLREWPKKPRCAKSSLWPAHALSAPAPTSLPRKRVPVA